MAEKTIDELTDDMFNSVKDNLGPLYKNEDEDVLKNSIAEIRDEAFQIANRMFPTPGDFIDLKSIIFQTSTIAYENRGIEGQTKQSELGQSNEFIDWHSYLQKSVITSGKRWVI